MAFERLKTQIITQTQEANAKLRRDQTLLSQQKSTDLIQQNNRERREAAKTAQLRECFESSQIDELTNELLKLISGMEKWPMTPSDYYGEDSSFAKNYAYKETDPTDKKYFTITLKWNKNFSQWRGTDEETWSEINVGFLQDHSLIVDGKWLTGGFSKIPEEKWRGNIKTVSNAIERGYLHPRHESSTRLSDPPMR